MEECNINITGSRIQEVYDFLQYKNQTEFGRAIAEKLDQMYPAIEHDPPKRQTISNWTCGKTCPDVQQLQAIAALTNGQFDVGYLLGLYVEKNIGIKQIHENTGLSCFAIEKIQKWYHSDPISDPDGKFNLFFLNLLVQAPVLEKALKKLWDYRYLCDVIHNDYPLLSDIHNKEYERALFFESSDIKEEFIRRIYIGNKARIRPIEFSKILLKDVMSEFEKVVRYIGNAKMKEE